MASVYIHVYNSFGIPLRSSGLFAVRFIGIGKLHTTFEKLFLNWEHFLKLVVLFVVFAIGSLDHFKLVGRCERWSLPRTPRSHKIADLGTTPVGLPMFLVMQECSHTS